MTELNKLPGIISAEYLNTPTKKLKELSPKLYPKYKDIWGNLNVIVVKFKYKDKEIIGYIVEPKKGLNLPCVVYNRGGIGDFGKIENKHLYFILANMASWGYVVTAVEYGEFDEYGGEDVEQVETLNNILRGYTKINSDKVGLFGASRGGMMNYLLLQAPTFAKCAVVRAGVSNQERGYELRPKLRKLDSHYYNSNNPHEIAKRSGVDFVDKLDKDIPLLLLHGTNDEQVSPLDSLEMATEMCKHNIQFSLYMFNGDDHKLSKNKVLVNQETKKWFDTYL